MNFAERMTQAYFNFVYNQVYDFTTARLSCYCKLHQTCISKLNFEDNDRVLCVGLGTGNEIVHILQLNRNVNIVGVDYSNRALQKAYKKASRLGKEIGIFTMDTRCLEFAAGSFDKVLCIHVMDFIDDKGKATAEIFRVLKDGGQFVITYPSRKEGLQLGMNLLKDSIAHNVESGRRRVRAFFKSLVQVVMGIVYLPLLLRRNNRPYSRDELETLIAGLSMRCFQIEEDPVYYDFIGYGRK